MSFIFGGEGMSESMRRYLLDKGIASVYGSYGASDLELNIAADQRCAEAQRLKPAGLARNVERT